MQCCNSDSENRKSKLNETVAQEEKTARKGIRMRRGILIVELIAIIISAAFIVLVKANSTSNVASTADAMMSNVSSSHLSHHPGALNYSGSGECDAMMKGLDLNQTVINEMNRMMQGGMMQDMAQMMQNMTQGM